MSTIVKPLLLLFGFLLLGINTVWSQWQNEIFRAPQPSILDSLANGNESFEFEIFRNRIQRRSNKPYLGFFFLSTAVLHYINSFLP